MKLDDNGYQLIAHFEGLKLKPYLCDAGIPTIGYGNTFYPGGKKVTTHDTSITKEYALEIFKGIANDFASNVSKLLSKQVTQNQFNAMVSLAYNIGIGAFAKSTVLRWVNINPNDHNIAKAFLMWKNAGGQPILLSRRIKESQIYFNK